MSNVFSPLIKKKKSTNVYAFHLFCHTLSSFRKKKKKTNIFQHATNAYVSVRLNLILYLNSQGSRSVILSITGMQVVQGIETVGLPICRLSVMKKSHHFLSRYIQILYISQYNWFPLVHYTSMDNSVYIM